MLRLKAIRLRNLKAPLLCTFVFLGAGLVFSADQPDPIAAVLSQIETATQSKTPPRGNELGVYAGKLEHLREPLAQRADPTELAMRFLKAHGKLVELSLRDKHTNQAGSVFLKPLLKMRLVLPREKAFKLVVLSPFGSRHEGSDLLSFGLSPQDLQVIEYAVLLSEKKAPYRYEKMIQLAALRQTLINQWAYSRMGMAKEGISVKALNPHSGLLSVDGFWEDLWASDAYASWSASLGIPLLSAQSKKQPFVSASAIAGAIGSLNGNRSFDDYFYYKNSQQKASTIELWAKGIEKNELDNWSMKSVRTLGSTLTGGDVTALSKGGATGYLKDWETRLVENAFKKRKAELLAAAERDITAKLGKSAFLNLKPKLEALAEARRESHNQELSGFFRKVLKAEAPWTDPSQRAKVAEKNLKAKVDALLSEIEPRFWDYDRFQYSTFQGKRKSVPLNDPVHSQIRDADELQRYFLAKLSEEENEEFKFLYEANDKLREEVQKLFKTIDTRMKAGKSAPHHINRVTIDAIREMIARLPTERKPITLYLPDPPKTFYPMDSQMDPRLKDLKFDLSKLNTKPGADSTKSKPTKVPEPKPSGRPVKLVLSSLQEVAVKLMEVFRLSKVSRLEDFRIVQTYQDAATLYHLRVAPLEASSPLFGTTWIRMTQYHSGPSYAPQAPSPLGIMDHLYSDAWDRKSKKLDLAEAALIIKEALTRNSEVNASVLKAAIQMDPQDPRSEGFKTVFDNTSFVRESILAFDPSLKERDEMLSQETKSFVERIYQNAQFVLLILGGAAIILILSSMTAGAFALTAPAWFASALLIIGQTTIPVGALSALTCFTTYVIEKPARIAFENSLLASQQTRLLSEDGVSGWLGYSSLDTPLDASLTNKEKIEAKQAQLRVEQSVNLPFAVLDMLGSYALLRETSSLGAKQGWNRFRSSLTEETNVKNLDISSTNSPSPEVIDIAFVRRMGQLIGNNVTPVVKALKIQLAAVLSRLDELDRIKGTLSAKEVLEHPELTNYSGFLKALFRKTDLETLMAKYQWHGEIPITEAIALKQGQSLNFLGRFRKWRNDLLWLKGHMIRREIATPIENMIETFTRVEQMTGEEWRIFCKELGVAETAITRGEAAMKIIAKDPMQQRALAKIAMGNSLLKDMLGIQFLESRLGWNVLKRFAPEFEALNSLKMFSLKSGYGAAHYFSLAEGEVPLGLDLDDPSLEVYRKVINKTFDPSDDKAVAQDFLNYLQYLKIVDGPNTPKGAVDRAAYEPEVLNAIDNLEHELKTVAGAH